MAGSYQDNEGATSCKTCERGAYCIEGAAAALPCKAGSFSNQTNLTSAAECTPTQPGFYAPTASTAPRPCLPGSYAPSERLDACQICPAGKIQPNAGRRDCLGDQVVLERLQVIRKTMTVDMSLDDYNATAVTLQLAAQYGIPPSLIVLNASGGSLNLIVTITLPSADSTIAAAVPANLLDAVVAVSDNDLSLLLNATVVSQPATAVNQTMAITLEASCSPGSYCPAGSVAPLPCPKGTRANASIRIMTSPAECANCGKGTFCPVGSSDETRCRPGTYNPEEKQERCFVCLAGEYQDAEGATACKNCTDGYYCAEGASAPLPCPGGTTKRTGVMMTSAADCRNCSVGTYCPVGSEAATNCSAGTYNDRPNQETCTRCAAGTYQDAEGQSACHECRDGYCPLGSMNPISCELGARLDHSTVAARGAVSEAACVCKVDYYNSGASPTSISCAPCMTGTNCSQNGTTIAVLPIKRGYYRLSLSSTDIVRCPDARSGCAGAHQCDKSNSGCRGTVDGGPPCYDGLEGVFCSVCASHNESQRVYYAPATSTERAMCKACGVFGLDGIAASITVLALAALVALATFLLYRSLSASRKYILIAAWNSFTPLVKIKVIISGLQILTKIATVYGIELPYEVQQLLSSFAWNISFGISAVGMPLECLGWSGYESKLVFFTVTPLVIALLVVLAAAIAHSLDATSQRAVVAIVQVAVPKVLWIFFLVYPLVTVVAFEAFPCYEIDEREFLKADVTVECGTTAHQRAKTLAWITILMYPVGLLLVNAVLLYCARRAILERRPSVLSSSIAFLWREYKPDVFWWEVGSRRTLVFSHLPTL